MAMRLYRWVSSFTQILKWPTHIFYFRRLNFNYILTVGVLIFIAYTEIIAYYLNTHNWHHLKCENRKECMKILLVADPQIIGLHDEPVHFLTPFTILDSDKYVKLVQPWQPNLNCLFQLFKEDILVCLRLCPARCGRVPWRLDGRRSHRHRQGILRLRSTNLQYFSNQNQRKCPGTLETQNKRRF